MNIILHTTHCPQCKILETKLRQSHIQFEENNDVDVMLQKGFRSAPILEVDGVAYNLKEAINWIKGR